MRKIIILTFQKRFRFLAPIFGAGAIGVCPLCWIGSASLLTYLGLGVLIPWWPWLGLGLIAIGALGFILDYNSHHNPIPLITLLMGSVLLFGGRYLAVGAWYIWGFGVLFIIVAVFYNRYLFKKPSVPQIS